MRRSLALVLCLGASFGFLNSSFAAVTETESDIVGSIGKIDPVYRYAATDGVRLTELSGTSSTELDNASIGTASMTTGTGIYWELDSSNNLRAHASLANAWRTFKLASVTSSWNATTTLSLAEDVRDGSSGPGSPYALKIILTKASTGSPADLTRAVLASFLAKSTTKAFTASSSGTALTSSSALTTGWTAKAYAEDGSAAAVAVTLDPVSLGIGVNVTPLGGTAVSFTTAVSSLYDWNVATNATTAKDVNFNAASGRTMKMKLYPGTFVHTAGISDGLLAAINAMPARVSQTNKSYLGGLASSLDSVLALFDSSAPASLKTGFNVLAKAAVASSNTAIGDFTTTADTNKFGLVTLGGTNLTSVTWSANNKSLVATGKYGSGAAKDFTVDLTSIEVVKAGTNEVLELKSSDGDAIWIKCVDATGYDTSANTTVSASSRDSLLVLQLLNAVGSTATIAASPLKAMIVASQS